MASSTRSRHANNPHGYLSVDSSSEIAGVTASGGAYTEEQIRVLL